MKQLDLRLDPCRSRHRGNRESIAAHDSIRSRKATILQTMIDHLAGCSYYGATCNELEAALGLSHQTASARCTELLRAGTVKRSGYRITGSGCKASVLTLSEIKP